MAENFLKYGLIAGSVYVIAKAFTKDKILSDKNVRNTVIGGGLGYGVGPKLEEMLKTNKKQAAYVSGGAIAGYVAEKLMASGTLQKAMDYSKEKLGVAKTTVAKKE